jgi:mycothiol synthase
MSASIRPYSAADLETLRALITAPGMAAQFDKFQGDAGLERMLGDPHLYAGALRLAFEGEGAAGFAISYLLPHDGAPFAMHRIGVREQSRRRGIATALLASAEAWAAAQTHLSVGEQSSSAWVPEPAADALAARSGYAHDRWYWLMERPRGGAPQPVWPAGVTTRPWDGSDAMLEHAVAAYNDSFAQHHRFIRGSVSSLRRIMTREGSTPGQLCVAYRGEAPVGFCRCERFGLRGEIGVLGTVLAARGIGLGRALLRWGVLWLEANTTTPVTLLVDGDNEGALALYKSEGFAVTRTRRVWSKPVARG